MSQGVQKITISVSSDDEILGIVKSKGICDESATLRWIPVNIGDPTEPSSETAAVIVDLTTSRGALRIYDKSTDSLIGGVFMDVDSGRTMVPWSNSWCFRASGSPRLAYIEMGKK
ncbi:hypothetical protein BGW36DRAFT_429545 [Talaromyces proteolyticus]|uniref:Uncharacterized protein n=1 Tax=Talaromyces proteolyticus TaxID=1131652 RepID=A0AAD4PZH3_9EURO|nr:uncharacterized protein BGW36DRAFT_429545 [Talaromyces proteolyticus]KAH8695684.1 hypothetical protein BGW36DRAFT_429545 [Talaromyces proteolyticus]